MRRARHTARAGIAIAIATIVSIGQTASAQNVEIPSLAAISADPLSALSRGHRTATEGALDRAAVVRAAAASGSYRGFMAATSGATATASLPQPTQHDFARVAGLPTELQMPVAGLWAAVRAVRAAMGTIPKREFRAEVRALLAGFRTFPKRAAQARHNLPVPSPFTMPPVSAKPNVSLLGDVDLGASTKRALRNSDQGRQIIAAALDAYLPVLLAAAGDGARGTAVDACDLLDQRPHLCVSSEADSTYTGGDAALVIDLGGNDSFGTQAGAAPFLADEVYVPIAVAVDLDGDDTHTAPELPIGSGAGPGAFDDAVTIGQGSGLAGGLGILVDVSGNDVYETSMPSHPIAPGHGRFMAAAVASAQGSGVLGAGFLFDGDGDDDYMVGAPSTGASLLGGVFGQGNGQYSYAGGCSFAAGNCSEGALVDLGGGDDTYVLAGSELQQPDAHRYALAAAVGQGSGATAAGFLVDDGGDDSFSATVSAVAHDHKTSGGYFDGPLLAVNAQGYASAGTGMLLEGPGVHSYEIAATGEGMSSNIWEASGQAMARLASVAVLQDLGEKAGYSLRGSITERFTSTVEDSCGCERAQLAIDTYHVGFAPVSVLGQGAAKEGTSVLDNHGSGTYDAAAIEDIDVTLKDHLTAATGPATVDVIGHQPPEIIVQGSQDPILLLFLEPSYALLLNRNGSATYNAVSRNTVEAAATSVRGDVPVVTGTTPYQFNYSAMQGAGVWNGAGSPASGEGALIDLGGPGNSFTASQVQTVTTSPDTGRSFAAGAFWMPMQGAGNGGILIAAGESPRISASPSNGICPASPSARGFGQWLECSSYLPPEGFDDDHIAYDFLGGNGNPGTGGGFAPMSEGLAPSLQVLSAPVSAPNDSAPLVSARLQSPGGPVAGAPLHLNLQLGIPIPRAGVEGVDGSVVQWVNISQAEAITGADGIAEVRLPLALKRMFGLDETADWYTRVMVTYDGGAGLSHAHASLPLVVTPAGS